MSCYEHANGDGVAKQQDLRELRNILMDTYNAEVAKYKPKELKKFYVLSKANTRTKVFPILDKGGDRLYDIGTITIDVSGGKFHFYIEDNNHSVDVAERDSRVYNELLRFMRNMPEKGQKYGAKLYYYNEYMTDQYGNKAGGTYTYFGGWIPHSQRRLKDALVYR